MTTPIGREPTCALAARPERRTSFTWSSVSRHVDRAGHRSERVEIIAEALPVELHAFAQDCAGNVLDAFHQVDQVGRLARPHRCEAYAAIAEHRGGDAVPRGRRDERIPGGLAVIVGMDVDEARRDDQSGRVDSALRQTELRTNGGNPSVLHGHIGYFAGCAGSVDHGAVSDNEVKHGRRIGLGRPAGLCCGPEITIPLGD
jgi:hypothetical protein